MPVEVRYVTDPACPWSWGGEPTLRRLIWEFEGELDLRWVMGGLARSLDAAYRDEEGRIGSGPDRFADLIAQWLEVAAETGMPLDPRLWIGAKITSTYPACQGVVAACEQGPDAGYRYLRRAREALLCERRKLDHPDALIAAAGAAGLDVDRFAIDLRSNAIVEAFGAQLEEGRDVPAEAREQGAARATESHERPAFPSAVFIGADRDRHGVYGRQPYERYRQAALAAGATPRERPAPAPLEAIERFGRCATRELEVLTGRPRPPLEAELWALAREWRLKPVDALTGTLWEQA